MTIVVLNMIWNPPICQTQKNGCSFRTTDAILRPFNIWNLLVLFKKIYFLIGSPISWLGGDVKNRDDPIWGFAMFVQKTQIKGIVSNCIIWCRTAYEESCNPNNSSYADRICFVRHHTMQFETIPQILLSAFLFVTKYVMKSTFSAWLVPLKPYNLDVHFGLFENFV